MYNKILLIGNLVKDAEVKSIKDNSVSKFRLAVNDPYREKNTLYIDCEAWGKEHSTFAEKWLKKGKGVIVDGRLCVDTWDDNGSKQSKFFVKVSEVRFSSSPSSEKTNTNSNTKTSSKEKNQTEESEEVEVPF